MEYQADEEEDIEKGWTRTMEEVAMNCDNPSRARAASSQAAADVNGNAQAKERPPGDDCCPICLDNLVLPCKTECRHWFCGRCILEWWNFGPVLQPCKCPVCCCLMIKLSPEASLLTRDEADVAQVLKNIEQYNSLCAGGWRSFFQKILALPLIIKRIFRDCDVADILTLVAVTIEVIDLLLNGLYLFGYIPRELMEKTKFFDTCISVVLILILLGVCFGLILMHLGRLFSPRQQH